MIQVYRTVFLGSMTGLIVEEGRTCYAEIDRTQDGDVMTLSTDVKRYRSNLQGEIDSASLYLAMAQAEPQPALAEVYRRLAKVEEKHARLWEAKLYAAGAAVPPRRPSIRARIKITLARSLGPHAVLPMIAAAEQADRGMYDSQPESQHTDLPADERSHARVLRAMRGKNPQDLDPSTLARLEGRHRDIGGNALRAAVLGANDGLLSNLSLVMGVVGANLSNRSVVIAGIAGLLAGSFSMAIGEWISVQSSRELSQFQLTIEADELTNAPEEEAEELALIYEAKGLSEDEARTLAARLMGDREKALDTLAREELGINPKELAGSPWEAAIASCCLFGLGAFVPLLPFLFAHGTVALRLAFLMSGLGLFAIGAGISVITGRSAWISGARQLLFGLVAAAVTFGIGHWVSTHLLSATV